MEVILLTKVDNLGDLGEKVRVKPGYVRNYLVPSGKAKPATAENIAEFEARRAELEKMAVDSLTGAEARKAELDGFVLTITAKTADEEGKLFGSVGTVDIVQALSEAGKAVEKKEIRLPSGVFKQTGEYQVDVSLHTDVIATIDLKIVPEG